MIGLVQEVLLELAGDMKDRVGSLGLRCLFYECRSIQGSVSRLLGNKIPRALELTNIFSQCE